MLRYLQQNRFGRINETDLGKVAFAQMAQSMGVPGERVASVDAFAQALDNALAATGPYLIDVDMEHFALHGNFGDAEIEKLMRKPCEPHGSLLWSSRC